MDGIIFIQAERGKEAIKWPLPGKFINVVEVELEK
jgi:hypothetical protein